jgi:hypothetical protein
MARRGGNLTAMYQDYVLDDADFQAKQPFLLLLWSSASEHTIEQV